jgi:two-component system cell cycle response regulator DivK
MIIFLFLSCSEKGEKFAADSSLIKEHLAICERGETVDAPSASEKRECGGVMLQVMPKKVLIVEDNELNMKLFSDLLEAHGYETVGTDSGLNALDLAREHSPDLILMDIQLPEVSGLEVTKWLKDDEELSPIPVIAVTAFAMKGDEERIREGGCEAYMSKPITVSVFIETIRQFLGEEAA